MTLYYDYHLNLILRSLIVSIFLDRMTSTFYRDLATFL